MPMMPWRSFVARAGVASLMVGVAVFVAMRLAVADPAGPPTRNALTFAGVLRNADGSVTTRATMLSFVFRRSGLPDCAAPVVSVVPNASGAFSALVPIDACGSTFFNGADVSYDVFIAGEDAAIASNVAVTPVPYARFADQAGVSNDCPAGYTRDTSDATITSSMRLCVRTVAGGRDEVVKVGSGASAFWIDRHEASVWNNSGTQFGASDDTYPNLLKTGQWFTPTINTPPLRALSRPDVIPSRNITWFQANEMCHAAGKRLPTGDEWLVAAQGTSDPATGNDGTAMGNSRCNTFGPGPRATNRGGAGCVSAWGAQDMVANLWEWTNEWYAGVGRTGFYTSDGTIVPDAGTPESANGAPAWASLPRTSAGWHTDYAGDATWNINSAASYRPLSIRFGIPSAAVRGGVWNDGPLAGIFALRLDFTPSNWDNGVGFRCVIPR